jgi:transcriptional antiterminator NusG
MQHRSGSTGESVAEADVREDGAAPAAESAAADAAGSTDRVAPEPPVEAGGATPAGESAAAVEESRDAAGEARAPGQESREHAEDAPEASEEAPESTEAEAPGSGVATEPPEPTPREGMHWFALQVYLGHENKVKNLLEKRVVELRDPSIHVGDVMVPTQEVVEVKGGKKVKVTRNLYPGYLLVEMKPNEETLHFVNNVHGVIKFLGAGKLPQPLRPREIARILGKIEEIREAPEIVEIPFDPGDAVQVTDGPFSDFHGTVEEVYPEKGKVKVTVSLFGRPTSVELDYLQLRKL